MKSVTFTEFHKHTSTLMAEVEKGEIIQLLRHGKPVIKMIPINGQEKKTPAWKQPALRLKIKGKGLTETILEERASYEL